MPRIARIVIPGCPHHVTQRGNHRQKVFFAETGLLNRDLWRTRSDGQVVAAEETRTQTWFNQAKSRLNFEVVAPVPETFIPSASLLP